jgi:hypothetical protein
MAVPAFRKHRIVLTGGVRHCFVVTSTLTLNAHPGWAALRWEDDSTDETGRVF